MDLVILLEKWTRATAFDLAERAAAGREHFQLVDGERFPCGPEDAVAAHNSDLPQGRPGHPLAVVPEGGPVLTNVSPAATSRLA